MMASSNQSTDATVPVRSPVVVVPRLLMLPEAPVAVATAAAATTTTTTTTTATATDSTAANGVTTSTVITSIATAATDMATHSATIAIDTATTARATVAVITTAVSLDAGVVTTSQNATDSTISPKSVDSNAALAIHEMTELQISGVDDNNAVFDVLTNDNKSPNVLNKSTSITIRPINELTTGLKRALSNAMVVNDKFKKCKSAVGDEEINVPNIVDSNKQEVKGDNNIKIGKLKSCTTIKKLSDVKKVNDCSISNEIPKENSVIDIPDKQNDGHTINLSAANHKVYSPSKKCVPKEIGGENQSSNIKHISQKKIMQTQTIEDSENDYSSQLMSSSCLFKLISVEDADKNDDNADNFSPLSKSIISADNVTSITKSNINQSNTNKLVDGSVSNNSLLKRGVLSDDQDILSENIPSFSWTENQNKTIATEEENESSDSKNDEQNDIALNKEIKENRLPQILKLLVDKNFNYSELESICYQLFTNVMIQKIGNGTQRKNLQLFLEREKNWKLKYNLLYRQCQELKAIIKMHKKELKTNPYAKPHLITRSVGLQTTLSPKINNSSVQLSTANTTSTSTQPNEPIDISSDDESDVIALDTVTNTTPNKQIPSITNALPINGNVKSVPSAVPIVNNDKNCIYLTDDDIEVFNGTATKPHVLPKNLTYIELPNLAKSSYIVRAQSSLEHNQNANITSLKSIDQEPNKGPILYSSEQYLPVQLVPNIGTKLVKQSVSNGQTLKPIQSPSNLKPVNINHRSLKPLIPVITNKISASKPIGSLQPVPAAIPLKKHPAPLPATPTERSVGSLQKPPPAPKISLAPSTDRRALLLSWNMNITKTHAEILSYQIYAYKEITSDIPKTEIWKEIGNIKALSLPMACSLTKFAAGDKYHFAVRAMDVYFRIGPFSSPKPAVFP